jgi:signal transduction histidine kinase
MLSVTSALPGGSVGSPFRGPALWASTVPFAIVAVLAEASLTLPPEAKSRWAILASVVLLLAVPAEFMLPWSRLPWWMPVLVPLTYTGSVLALLLATGPSSGVGVVILVPLIWTALFHRPWESACVVAAVVAVEVIVSVLPVTDSDSVIARRAILWALLGALVSVATHGLRERIRRSQRRSAQLQSRLRELTILADRDRIAADLRDKVIQRMFTAGMTLQSAASRTADPEVQRRIETSIDQLDQAVRLLRDAIFGLEQRPDGRRLRQEVMDLCGDLSPAPDITFSGPVDGIVIAGTRAQVIDMLRAALDPIRKSAVPARIGIAADDGSCRTVIEAGPVPGTATEDGQAGAFSGLRHRAAAAGLPIEIEEIPGGTRLAWNVPHHKPASGGPARGGRAAPAVARPPTLSSRNLYAESRRRSCHHPLRVIRWNGPRRQGLVTGTYEGGCDGRPAR